MVDNDPNSQEELFREIVESVRDTLDLEKVKRIAVTKLGEALNADRCRLVQYDSSSGHFQVMRDEYINYLSADSNFKTLNIEKDFDLFVQLTKDRRSILYNNKKFYLDEVEESFPNELDVVKKHGISSFIFLPLIHNDELLGVLSVYFIEHKHYFSKKEIEFLNSLAKQIAIAIFQAKLYRITQMDAKKEAVMRKIAEYGINNIPEESLTKMVVTDMGKLFEADRCFYVEVDVAQSKSMGVKESDEYLSSDKIKSHVERVPTKEEVSGFIDEVKEKKMIIIEDVLNSDLSEPSKQMLFYDLGVKSFMEFPVLYGSDLYGAIVMHYVNDYRHFDQEEIDMAQLLVKQAASVIQHNRLYNIQILNAKRERLIADLVSKSLSTFDLYHMKDLVQDIGVMLGADRCFFVEIDEKNKKGFPIDYEVEYLSSSEIKSITGYDFVRDDVEAFIDSFVSVKDLIFYDYVRLAKHDKDKYRVYLKYSEKFNIKTGIGIPILIDNILKAVLAIEFVKNQVIPKKDDFDFLRILGKQINMVYQQIRLFNITKLKAEREELLRKIFEAMRSSLDMKEVHNSIVTEVGKIFDADYCRIISYNPDSNKYIIEEYAEYKRTSDLYSVPAVNAQMRGFNFFVSAFENNKEILFDNVENFIVDANIQGTPEADFLYQYNLKSNYCVLIKYSSTVIGYLCVQYVRDYVELSEDDIKFIRIIADQAGVALQQAKLYEKIKQQAERERMSRNIIEILRSSIDKEIIKKLFVKTIGKFFNADRVYFAEYDSKEKIYLPVDESSEYLSNDSQKSFVGLLWNTSETLPLIQPLLEKREVKITDFDEYLSSNPDKRESLNLIYGENGIKSTYKFPVMYQYIIMGFFCIDFTHDANRLTDEDISRIRSICSQAGVALYHADLYMRAQEAAFSREAFVNKVSDKIKEPTNDILENTTKLSNHDYDRHIQLEYLNNIINSCNTLLELTTFLEEI